MSQTFIVPVGRSGKVCFRGQKSLAHTAEAYISKMWHRVLPVSISVSSL